MRLETHARAGPGGPESVRRHPRGLFTVPLTLRYLTAGGVRSSRGISLDISEGGVGALVQSSLQVGDTVTIDMQLPPGRFSAVAIVRHSSNVSSGFEFVGLTAEERSQIVSVAGHSGGLPVAPAEARGNMIKTLRH